MIHGFVDWQKILIIDLLRKKSLKFNELVIIVCCSDKTRCLKTSTWALGNFEGDFLKFCGQKKYSINQENNGQVS